MTLHFHRQAYSACSSGPSAFLAAEKFVFLVILLFASLAWLGIAWVEEVSDHARLAEVSLRHIEGMSHELNALEEQASAERRFSSFQQSRAEEINLHMRREIGSLRRLLPLPSEHEHLAAAYTRYWQAEEGELRQIQNGHIASGETIASRLVDPAFSRMIALIVTAIRHNDALAARAYIIANSGTAVILFAAVLAMFALFKRFLRAQRVSVDAEVRLAAQETLRQGHQRFAALASNASDVIAITSPNGEIHYVASNTERLWGYTPEDLLHSAASSLVHPEDTEHFLAMLLQASRLAAGESLTIEARIRNACDVHCSSEVIFTNLLTEPAVAGLVMTCRDVTERKAFEEQLTHQAFHDALTGLPNRALLAERLQQALARSRRTQAPVGLLYLDLDNFKFVNDSLGHNAGDTLLINVAERLQTCIRPGDTVARLGGDEFTILMEDLADEDQVMGVAERIADTLRAPMIVGGRELFVTGSFGSAISRGDERTPNDLLRDADTAMYQAKTSGKARCVLFDFSMNSRAVERLELEGDLRRALSNGELRVYYQPIMHLDSDSISAVEALVRWEHPERGLIEPGKFIPLAEESGLIVPLGQWVLAEACRQTRDWQTLYPTQTRLTVSVNLSARQLQQPDLVERVAEVLSDTGFDAAHLKLEITETVMIHDAGVTIPKLHRLRDIGVCLAIDDFGTGYSSLSYLSSLPLDTLKIDRSFVKKMGKQGNEAAIVRAIVSLAKTLNLSITSEGIETPEQLAELKALGCDHGQGYLFSRPVCREAMEELLGAAPRARHYSDAPTAQPSVARAA